MTEHLRIGSIEIEGDLDRAARSAIHGGRQLEALLRVVRASREELRPEHQASIILDELVATFRAHRGSIWFQSSPETPGVSVTRHHGPAVPPLDERPRESLLRMIRESVVPSPTRIDEHDVSMGNAATFPIAPNEDDPFDADRTIAVPLHLRDVPVGALCVERGSDAVPFTSEDRTAFALLSHQVPIVFENARLVLERDRLHASIQHTKKMDAMGQFAGGLAHDFNNMIAAMRIALTSARDHARLDEDLAIELDIISQATLRALRLTSRLLGISGREPVTPGIHDVNQLVTEFLAVARSGRLGSNVSLVTNLSPTTYRVEVDPASFDQALVQLLVRASDAMPGGGTITISTRNVSVDEPFAGRHGVTPGPYVEIEVADTGAGLSAADLARVFEPFVTTKPFGDGHGLDLTMVYAFARRRGGTIDVTSEPGRGTTFRLYLARADRSRTGPSAKRAPLLPSPASSFDDRPVAAPDTILVVDDDDLVRRSIAKILERNGYRVVAASGSSEALDVAQQMGARIGLVILDVLMPGLTGPELGRRMYDLNLSAKLLFVSGFSRESIPMAEVDVAAEMLQKPFSQSVLLERVRQLMHS